MFFTISQQRELIARNTAKAWIVKDNSHLTCSGVKKKEKRYVWLCPLLYRWHQWNTNYFPLFADPTEASCVSLFRFSDYSFLRHDFVFSGNTFHSSMKHVLPSTAVHFVHIVSVRNCEVGLSVSVKLAHCWCIDDCTRPTHTLHLVCRFEIAHDALNRLTHTRLKIAYGAIWTDWPRLDWR